jgi:hypothetical protein
MQRARAEWAAARACLRDRRAGLAASEVHLGRAFAALLADGDRLAPLPELGARARAATERPWGAALAALAPELDALASSPPRTSAKAARRRARRLQRALARLVVAERGSARRFIAAVTLGVALLAVALAWSTRRGTGSAVGFQGSYFARPDLSGPPTTRRDPRIDFTWLARAPLSGLPADHFSARWDGCFELAKSERLTFRVGSDDGSRVLLDGKLLVDNWRDQGGNWMERSLEVAPGVHRLRVEYYERGGDAFVVFELTRDGAPVGEGFVRPPAVLEPEVRCEAP